MFEEPIMAHYVPPVYGEGNACTDCPGPEVLQLGLHGRKEPKDQSEPTQAVGM